jgi:hypothetical protein
LKLADPTNECLMLRERRSDRRSVEGIANQRVRASLAKRIVVPTLIEPHLRNKDTVKPPSTAEHPGDVPAAPVNSE